jgi:hypothetical protein
MGVKETVGHKGVKRMWVNYWGSVVHMGIKESVGQLRGVCGSNGWKVWLAYLFPSSTHFPTFTAR